MVPLHSRGFDADFVDEDDGPFISIATEQPKTFLGRPQTECEHYKFACKRFMKCFCDCNEQLIPASNLESAGEKLSDEKREEAKHIMTNPCVGMFAFCLSVDFFTLRSVLKLQSPDAF
ncbi:hypothetical protein Y032_0031g2264 [Ancylostoma ceylanicum]|nr:hypothetical protein Y032_0031g2264 [Ancylostoma ceylanicum]